MRNTCKLKQHLPLLPHSFSGSTLCFHKCHLYLPSVPSSIGRRGMGGHGQFLWLFLPPHPFPLFQCGSSPGAAVLQDKLLLHEHSIQEISTFSSMGSWMGLQGDTCSTMFSPQIPGNPCIWATRTGWNSTQALRLDLPRTQGTGNCAQQQQFLTTFQHDPGPEHFAQLRLI